MNHVINWLFLACGFPVAQIEVYSRVCLACQVPDIVLIPHTDIICQGFCNEFGVDFGFHQCSGSSNWVIKRYIFGPITPYYYPLDLRSGFSKMAALCHKHLYQKNLQQKPGSAFYVLTGKTILISKNNFKQTTRKI